MSMSETFRTIVSKRDVRQYDSRPLSEQTVRRILDAGRVSGSARNRQPWMFYVAEAPENRARLSLSVYVPPTVGTAALAVALVAFTPESGLWAFDVGRAAQNMMLAAWDSGVASCPNGIADPQVLVEELSLHEGWAPVTVLSFGYPATPHRRGRRSDDQWIARAPRRPASEVEVWLDGPAGS